jgi:6-phosphogluconolactonase (cycloisomerase 2 family)
MAMKVKVLLSSVLVLSMTWLASCGGHYQCGTTFGTTCSSGSGTTRGSGGTTGATSAYVFTADGGGIEELSLNTTANTLLDTTGFTDPTTANVPGGVLVVAQDKYLYTSFPSVGEIYGWTISANGDLTTIGGSPFSAAYMIGSTLGGSQSMITNPAGTLLFVLNQTDGAVYVYQIGSSGVLTLSGSPVLVPFEPENMATDGLGKYLYVSNVVAGDATDEIAAYSIGSSGSLTAVSGSPFISTGSSLEYSMFQMQGDPSGQYMIGTTGGVLGDNHLYVFGIQQSGANAGAITPVSGSPFATVYSPYRIAVQPSSGGDLVYSFSLNGLGTGDNPIEGYQLNLSTGALTVVSGSPFSGGGTGESGQFDQSGAYLFVYDGYTTVLAAYQVGSTGALTPVASVGSVGPWTPTDVP